MANETGLKGISEGRSDIFKVSPASLHVKDGWNSREANDAANIEHIDNLARSIAEIGVKEPLTVYWEAGKAWISDGHCRHAAVLKAIEVYGADIKTIPVKTEDRYSSEPERILSQLVRNSGKPLSSIEQGTVFKRLIDHGWQAKDIAKKVGMSPARISQILEFNTIPEQIKALVLAGSVSAGMAMDTVKSNEGDKVAATEQLTQAVLVANGQGRKRALPKDMGASKPNMKTAISKAVKDAIDYSDVDDSGEMCVIKMPMEQWDKIRDLLKL